MGYHCSVYRKFTSLLFQRTLTSIFIIQCNRTYWQRCSCNDSSNHKNKVFEHVLCSRQSQYRHSQFILSIVSITKNYSKCGYFIYMRSSIRIITAWISDLFSKPHFRLFTEEYLFRLSISRFLAKRTEV